MMRLFAVAVAALAFGNAARFINSPDTVESAFGFIFLLIGVGLVVALAADLDGWWSRRSANREGET